MMVERRSPVDRSAAAQGATPPVYPGSVRRRQHITKQRVLLALGCLFGGAIVVNAIAFQTEKHPSPLFRPIAKGQDPFPVPPLRADAQAASRAPAQPSASRPVTPEKPAADRGRPNLTGSSVGDETAEPVAAEALRSKPSMKEELLDLVKRSAIDDRATRTIADIQRALNKAGYGPLTEDGQMGPSTKQALAKFEADRKLPPRGEPRGPVLKVLASASGIPIAQ